MHLLFTCVSCLFCTNQKMVIQTKSVEYMPLFLSLASLVNGICWTAYALIRFDLYITVSKAINHQQLVKSPSYTVRFTVSPYQHPVERHGSTRSTTTSRNLSATIQRPWPKISSSTAPVRARRHVL